MNKMELVGRDHRGGNRAFLAKETKNKKKCRWTSRGKRKTIYSRKFERN